MAPSMQNSSLLTIFLFVSIAALCRGNSHHAIQAPSNRNSWPHPAYGAPPPTPEASVICTDQRLVQTPAQASTTPAHTIGPLESIHGHRLPNTNAVNLAAEVANGQLSHYIAPKYLPPPGSSHSKPYYQPLTSVSGHKYGKDVADSNTPYTQHYNPLIAPQYSQPSPPTALTPPPPPPPPPSPQTSSNRGSQWQRQSFGLPQSFAEKNREHGTSGSATNTQSQPADNSRYSIVGNYISQSEVGQLDYYNYKQNPVGDPRAYSRLIHNCYPDGHCEQLQLSAGQLDRKHQHIVLMARARIQPIADKCRSLTAQGATGPSAGSASLNASNALPNTQNLLRNRRLYPYTEVLLPHQFSD